MTNIELITQAFRALNIIDENESPSAEQGVQGLTLLNQMLAQWQEGDDVNIQYFEQTEQQATFPCQKYTEKGVIGKLAEALSAHYGISMTPEAALMSKEGYETIIRKSVSKVTEPLSMAHLPRGRGHGGRGNILTGED